MKGLCKKLPDLRGAALGLVVWLQAQAAWAASDGSEFQGLYELVSQWSTGFLGKTIAVAFLLVGLGMGVIRGSVMAVVAAIAAAAALILLPGIVDAMFTAYNTGS
ncbi:MAG: TraA family conjugative transfer protein [Duodenibacillus sp.]|nr:TraA family conjugative transfer protein [Duodenibacillus sp.]